MRLISASVLALLLSSAAVLAAPPSPAPSPARPSVLEEASWLSYYRFLSAHPTLSGDALLPALADGRRIRLEAAASALADSIADHPEEGMRSLDAAIDAAAWQGHDARAAFAPVLAALRSRSLDADESVRAHIESSADALAARLDSVPDADPASPASSGYLAWLAARCGTEGDTPDADYLKAFPDAPWNLGLLKFCGDLHYFTRSFDKAIDLYRRAIAKEESGPGVDDPWRGSGGGTPAILPSECVRGYSPFFESEVRRRIGQCHLICDRFDSAAVELTRAASLSAPPESAVSRLLAAHGLIRAKSPDAALPLLQTALREGGGDGAPLPDAIVNSLKVQEALAWRAKGDPKKALELLAGFGTSPNPAFLFPSDRKMTWLLMASGYRAAGEEEKAADAVKHAESEPPLSPAQKLDPMNERYEAFVEKNESGLAGIVFFIALEKYYDRFVIKGLANVQARPVVSIQGYRANGEVLHGCVVTSSEGLIPLRENDFEIDLQGGPGSYPAKIQITHTESGDTADGEIQRFLVDLKLSTVKLRNTGALLVHFEDRNFNGVFEGTERLSDGEGNPTVPDRVRDTNLSDAPYHWSAGGARTPCRVDGDLPSSFVLELIESPAHDVKAQVVVNYFQRPEVAGPSGTIKFPETNVWLDFERSTYSVWLQNDSRLASGIGITDMSLNWKSQARCGDLPQVETVWGTSTHRVYVTSPGVVNPYKCLVENALKFAAKEKAIGGKSDLEMLLRGLPNLRNDLGMDLAFSPLNEETEVYGSAGSPGSDLNMNLGRFLDAGRGNSIAWAKAFSTMAMCLGYSPELRTIQFDNFCGSTLEIVASVGGVHQGSPVNASFTIWAKGFPGTPSEKRGDILRNQSRDWMTLADHTIVFVDGGTGFDLIDPVFSETPWSYMKNMFTSLPSGYGTPIQQLGNFSTDYLLKLSPSFRMLQVACHNKAGKIELLDLTTDSVLLLSRPLEIDFAYEGEYKRSTCENALGRHPIKAVARFSGTNADDADTTIRGRDWRNNATPTDTKNQEECDERSSPELDDLQRIIEKADSGSPTAYREALPMCRDFIVKYPLSDYSPFIDYLFGRMLVLGLAIPGFETHYHIPGWWHEDPDFVKLKSTLLSSANIEHIEWLRSHARDSAGFDGKADAALLLGRYMNYAGAYEQAIKYLEPACDLKYRSHAPWAIAALAEACSNYANQKPEFRLNAIKVRSAYLEEFGDRVDLLPLSIQVLHALGADLLFNKNFAEAESVLKTYIDNFASQPDIPGVKLLLANAYANQSKFMEAEEQLLEIWEKDLGSALANAGYKPMAGNAYAKVLSDQGKYEELIAFAQDALGVTYPKLVDETEKVKPGKAEPDDPGYKPFYETWSKMHQAGLWIKLAEARYMTGSYETALAILDNVEHDFQDEVSYRLTRVGPPFPPMLYPEWGDDVGYWDSKKIFKKLFIKISEFKFLKIKFVNQFTNHSKYIKALCYLSIDKFELAISIFKSISKRYYIHPTNAFEYGSCLLNAYMDEYFLEKSKYYLNENNIAYIKITSSDDKFSNYESNIIDVIKDKKVEFILNFFNIYQNNIILNSNYEGVVSKIYNNGSIVDTIIENKIVAENKDVNYIHYKVKLTNKESHIVIKKDFTINTVDIVFNKQFLKVSKFPNGFTLLNDLGQAPLLKVDDSFVENDIDSFFIDYYDLLRSNLNKLYVNIDILNINNEVIDYGLIELINVDKKFSSKKIIFTCDQEDDLYNFNGELDSNTSHINPLDISYCSNIDSKCIIYYSDVHNKGIANKSIDLLPSIYIKNSVNFKIILLNDHYDVSSIKTIKEIWRRVKFVYRQLGINLNYDINEMILEVPENVNLTNGLSYVYPDNNVSNDMKYIYDKYGNNDNNNIYVFYIWKFNDEEHELFDVVTKGYAVPPGNGIYSNTIFISYLPTSPSVPAHELGHVFGIWKHDLDLRNIMVKKVWDSTYFDHNDYPVTGLKRFSDKQEEIIRNSILLRGN